jgi:hypothetical protein
MHAPKLSAKLRLINQLRQAKTGGFA